MARLIIPTWTDIPSPLKEELLPLIFFTSVIYESIASERMSGVCKAGGTNSGYIREYMTKKNGRSYDASGPAHAESCN